MALWRSAVRSRLGPPFRQPLQQSEPQRVVAGRVRNRRILILEDEPLAALIDPRFHRAPVLTKPIEPTELESALLRVLPSELAHAQE